MWPLGLPLPLPAYRAYASCPGCSLMTTVRHIEPSAVGLTQASTVDAVVMSSDAESGTVTMSFTPSNCRALPYLPATRVAPEIVPALPIPERSETVLPDASSKLQAPTRPLVEAGGAGCVGGTGVGVGV